MDDDMAEGGGTSSRKVILPTKLPHETEGKN